MNATHNILIAIMVMLLDEIERIRRRKWKIKECMATIGRNEKGHLPYKTGRKEEGLEWRGRTTGRRTTERKTQADRKKEDKRMERGKDDEKTI